MFEIVPNWHPVFVHFTIGLLGAAAAFYLLAWTPGSLGKFSLSAARANLFAGVLITIATVAAGFLAFNSVVHDEPSHLAMKGHRNWALATAAIWALIGAWEGWRHWRCRGRSLGVTVAVLAGAVMLGVTGFKGGELVFQFGLGVRALPSTADHPHGAADAHGRGAAAAGEAGAGTASETPAAQGARGVDHRTGGDHPSDGHDHAH